MKNNFRILITIALLILAFGFTSCLKKVSQIQFNTVITLSNAGTHFVTSDITVNPKDSLYFSYTVNSPTNMKYVVVQKNGTDISRDTLPYGSQNTFSAIKKFAADSAGGLYNYRILAKDTGGVFLGDYNVAVTVTSDFNFYSFKVLFTPDTTTKTNPSFFATTTGQIFSYSTGGANSALIDFGYLFDTALANKHTIYALNTTPLPNQVSFYDFTTWTKNATIFKKVASNAFASLTSGGALRSAGLTNLASGTSSKVVGLSTTITGNNYVVFRTAAGKYGAIQVNYISADSPAATTFISLDIKVQQ